MSNFHKNSTALTIAFVLIFSFAHNVSAAPISDSTFIPVFSLEPLEVVTGSDYNAIRKITNARPNTTVYQYKQSLDSSRVKKSKIGVADKKGSFSFSKREKMNKKGSGYRIWVVIGRKKSNIVTVKVGPATIGAPIKAPIQVPVQMPVLKPILPAPIVSQDDEPILSNGRVRLYYVSNGSYVGHGVVSRISSDGIKFTPELTKLAAFVDPEVIALSDQRFLLVAATIPVLPKGIKASVPAGIYAFVSSDGVNFGDPIKLVADGKIWIDPAIVKIEEKTYRLYYWSPNENPNLIHSATLRLK